MLVSYYQRHGRIRRSIVYGHAFDGSSPQEMEHCNVFSLKSKRHVTRVRTIPSSAPNTNTDTGSDVIRSNKNYISTTDEYKVAFSLRPSMAVARLQSNVCKRAGQSKNLALKACYVRPSTAVTYTDVTRDDRNVRVTTITHALRALSNSRLATVHL